MATVPCQPARARDAADGAPFEVGPRVVAQVLEVVEGVLDESREVAVVAGRSEDEPVARPDGFDQRDGALGAMAARGLVHRQVEGVGAEELDARAGLLGRFECRAQADLGRETAACRSPEPDDEWPVVRVKCAGRRVA
ncbi:hypothetical protein SAVCW2_42170 [Streptomyces avermitilis]|nr:hypothetical protein SAVCW2_42170 [Streptomyces avermitilis]